MLKAATFSATLLVWINLNASIQFEFQVTQAYRRTIYDGTTEIPFLGRLAPYVGGFGSTNYDMKDIPFHKQKVP